MSERRVLRSGVRRIIFVQVTCPDVVTWTQAQALTGINGQDCYVHGADMKLLRVVGMKFLHEISDQCALSACSKRLQILTGVLRSALSGTLQFLQSIWSRRKQAQCAGL